jgi:uncharacterized protein YueI
MINYKSSGTYILLAASHKNVNGIVHKQSLETILTIIIGNLKAVTHVHFTDINFKMHNIHCSYTEKLKTASKEANW